MQIFRAIKLCSAILMAFVILTAVPSRSYAESGTIRLKVTKVGFIVGVGGGSGILTFKGKNYRLSVGGVSAGTIGAAGADLVGTASNLRTAEDIAGSYSAVSAGVAVAGGAKAVALQNSNGVVLKLQGKQVGFEASLSLSGLTISVQPQQANPRVAVPNFRCDVMSVLMSNPTWPRFSALCQGARKSASRKKNPVQFWTAVGIGIIGLGFGVGIIFAAVM
jgi:hypothetical protein